MAAVAHRPELLILDKPSSGLDAVVRRDILDAIVRTVADDGRTIAIFSSHLLDEVERMSGPRDDHPSRPRDFLQRRPRRCASRLPAQPSGIASSTSINRPPSMPRWRWRSGRHVERPLYRIESSSSIIRSSRSAARSSNRATPRSRRKSPWLAPAAAGSRWRPRDHAGRRRCHPVGDSAAVRAEVTWRLALGIVRGSGLMALFAAVRRAKSAKDFGAGDRPGPRRGAQLHWVAVSSETERRTARLSVFPSSIPTRSDSGTRRRPDGLRHLCAGGDIPRVGASPEVDIRLSIPTADRRRVDRSPQSGRGGGELVDAQPVVQMLGAMAPAWHRSVWPVIA